MFNLARRKAVAYGSYYYFTTDWTIPTVFSLGTLDGNIVLKAGQEITDEEAEKYVYDIFFAYVTAECRFISSAISSMALNDMEFHNCKMAYRDKIDAIYGLKMFPKLYDTLFAMPIAELEEHITIEKDKRFACYLYTFEELRSEIRDFLAIDQSAIVSDVKRCREAAIKYAKDIYPAIDTEAFLPDDFNEDFDSLLALYVATERSFVDSCLRELSTGKPVQQCYACYIYKLFIADRIKSGWKSYLDNILSSYLKGFYNYDNETDYGRSLILDPDALFTELISFTNEE